MRRLREDGLANWRVVGSKVWAFCHVFLFWNGKNRDVGKKEKDENGGFGVRFDARCNKICVLT
jgi:hypothetical protein